MIKSNLRFWRQGVKREPFYLQNLVIVTAFLLPWLARVKKWHGLSVIARPFGVISKFEKLEIFYPVPCFFKSLPFRCLFQSLVAVHKTAGERPFPAFSQIFRAFDEQNLAVFDNQNIDNHVPQVRCIAIFKCASNHRYVSIFLVMFYPFRAEAVRFELTRPRRVTAFQAVALGRYATPPL